MADFEQTRLFQEALAPRSEESSVAGRREELRRAYLDLRANASLLAHEIPKDLQDFTLHDASHADYLWELASDIAGVGVTLTPTEGFVFGSASALHDLGLAVAAYPQGRAELEALPEWRDAAASALRSQLGRAPGAQEIENAPQDVRDAATQVVLRQQHADRARSLGELSWTTGHQQVWLIESVALREAYGWLIGQIAASHGWPLAYAQTVLGTPANPPAGYPGVWTVNSLKVACLLRAADAAHLDAGRAPTLLRAVRQSTGLAARHWTFQNKLQRPTVANERLRFVSGSPFRRDEAESWWLCYEMLRAVDYELREIESLFLHLGTDSFAAKGVLGAEDPRRVAELVKTEGWLPIDVSVRVSDVAGLVERMGGARLYGRDDLAPIRELIQNGQDAVRARRELESRSSDWGTITVALGSDQRGRFLEVRDTGVGMSELVLTTRLLDFGSSLWGSETLSQHLPGLASTSFQATGQFGIGFFSVLMLGSRVQVVTRLFDEAVAQTRVLELPKGVDNRPLLRAATPAERLIDGGTTVRVWLHDPSDGEEPLLFSLSTSDELATLCGEVAPALSVDMVAEVDRKTTRVLSADDWLEISGKDLVERIAGGPVRLLNELDEVCDRNGRIVGRAALDPGGWWGSRPSTVTVGGLHATSVSNASGLFVGESPNLARTSAVPLVDHQSLASWLTKQAASFDRRLLSPEQEVRLSRIVSLHGGNPGPLAICLLGQHGLSKSEVIDWARGRDEVAIVTPDDLESWAEAYEVRDEKVSEIDFHEDALFVPHSPANIFSRQWLGSPLGPDLVPSIKAAIGEAWCLDPDHLPNVTGAVDIGLLDGREVELSPTHLFGRP